MHMLTFVRGSQLGSRHYVGYFGPPPRTTAAPVKSEWADPSIYSHKNDSPSLLLLILLLLLLFPLSQRDPPHPAQIDHHPIRAALLRALPPFPPVWCDEKRRPRSCRLGLTPTVTSDRPIERRIAFVMAKNTDKTKEDPDAVLDRYIL